jgi:hypothetical protein
MCKTQDSEVALGIHLDSYVCTSLSTRQKLLEYQSGTAKNIELSHPGVSGIPMTLSLKTRSHMEMK